MTTTIVIFDDEPASLSALHALVERELPREQDHRILEAASVAQLARIMRTTARIDILVADIVMPEGQPSGIEVVGRLFPAGCATQVIYVSGSLEQATEVYQTDHVYFLLKPVDPMRLRDALERACANLARRAPQMLRIKVDHRTRAINVSTIRYLESSLHKVRVHCGSQTFETYARLDELQQQLPEGFSRCHRSYLVNLAHVSVLDETGLCLQDGTTLPVSRRRARQVQHDLLAYLSMRASQMPGAAS